MNFFVVSAGQPGSNYIEGNFEEIIASSEYAIHTNTIQKGTYYSIEPGDVLILKYQKVFVAYGIVIKKYEDPEKDFKLRVKVEEWIFRDKENPKSGVSRYGIQKATIEGGIYSTVKTVRPNFGLDKIKEINAGHTSFHFINEILKSPRQSFQKDGRFFELHEELFNHLLDKSEADPEFTFVVRDSNNSSNLDKGYWFFGEENLALSFWTGMDYPNKRPAVSFLINPDQHCKLVIQTDIYEDLREFFLRYKENPFIIRLDKKDDIFSKVYDEYQLTDYLKCLDDFLKTDFIAINQILDRIENSVPINEFLNDSVIKRFPLDEFNYRLNNLFRYRGNDSPELTIYSIEDEKRADSIKSIRIRDFGFIKDELLEIGESKWVFITGENGSGKTMLLRAIGTALGNRTLPRDELIDKDFFIEAELDTDGRKIPFKRHLNQNVRSKRAIVTRGLAMYGPYRLQQTTNLVGDTTFRKGLSKIGSFESLFEDNSKLLSLDKQLEIWGKSSNREDPTIELRIKRILSLLPKIIPDLRIVQFIEKRNGKYDFEYRIKSHGTDELISLKWNELSSGNRSILNLVSDIVIRLFNQQPKVTDPSELRGIILIDEIDLHLHPNAQKDLIIKLSETFPKAQFIVTTHSPIPLLGAPKNSAIFVVKRNWEKGIFTERLDHKVMFDRILPNALLNSPIFGMDDLIPNSKSANTDLILEDNYSDALLYTKLENDINSFLTNERIKNLIDMFKPNEDI